MNRAIRSAGFIAAILAAVAAAQVPDPALAKTNCQPSGELRGDPARGEQLQRDDCADCHGADGRGDVIVMHMDNPPKDQTDPAYMQTLSDAFLYQVICGGGTAVGLSAVMPAWGDYYTDQDIKDLIAYLRSLSGT